MNDKVINFMGVRRVAAALSIAFVLISIVSLAVRGLNFGLDFTGGTLVEVVYEQAEPLSNVRSSLANAGYPDAVVVNFGADTDVLVRLPQGMSPDLGDQILGILQETAGSEVELRRIEFVGPQVGEELREQGGLAILLALVVVLIYISMRFQLKFAFGAVVALGHDVIIVLGIFSLLQLDFDLTVLGALLAVIGYSLNDTIVVSDRIRENFRKLRKQSPTEVINISLTDTLGRTLVTSLTTLLVLLALLFTGGEMIRGFAQALTAGIVVGTYSSIYVAANFMLMLNINQEDLIIPEKEGEPIDDMP
ncbi:preprotein translocase subunit SecF [Litorivivens lipolytica]|uniref:Protein-export membrane protein SecF n=1 Tax=Litorivivens lipolytica TaxID=1524264 RepID=A0A7W4W1V7_9GAMM|nr:protein translocase subunit SecF [Litorivivens lipolytica]MBB3045880.1 preprotein translocase subunit SecF [Litorivivens lipolytica]